MKHIRLATTHDALAFAEIYRPIVLKSPISFETKPPSAVEMATRVNDILTHMPWLAYETDGEILGYAYAGKHRERAAYQWSVDVSVYVREGRRGQGIGRSLYQILFHLLRVQGFYVAHAGITLPNQASVGLHEGFGFHPIGVYPAVGFKFGCWHDVGWWQLELQPRVGEPAPPLPIDIASQRCEWTQILTER